MRRPAGLRSNRRPLRTVPPGPPGAPAPDAPRYDAGMPSTRRAGASATPRPARPAPAAADGEAGTAAGPGPLDAMICFDVYAATRGLTTAYRPLLDDLGLTYPQYLVMRVLWSRGPSAVRTLVEELHLDYGTLSPLLKRLETAGLVRRERRADDERSVLISPTADGAALEARTGHIGEAIQEATGLTDEETAELSRLLHKLNASVARTVR